MKKLILLSVLSGSIANATDIHCSKFVQPIPRVRIEETFTIPDNIQTWKTKSIYVDKVAELEFVRQNGLKFDLRIHQEHVGDIFVAEVSLGKEVNFEEPNSGFIYKLLCN